MDDRNFRRTTNWLLLGLSPQDQARIWPLLRRERLPARLYVERRGSRSHTVYFIEAGVVSNLETGDLRDPIEVGVIGREGMVGASTIVDLVPQRDSYVHIEGKALAVDCAEFQKVLSSSLSLRSYLYRYVQAQMVQISLAASAGVRASVQQRLARKLLMYHDRTGTDDLPLTHESMSLMLGTRRASVTNAIHNLEAENLIRARRGLLTIRDRAGLEKYCGPFYGAAEARYAEIMGGTPQISAEYGM
jgi:CRP-like cAMP-binding protein